MLEIEEHAKNISEAEEKAKNFLDTVWINCFSAIFFSVTSPTVLCIDNYLLFKKKLILLEVQVESQVQRRMLPKTV